MEGKKVKIEVSRVALVFIILFGLCLLVWSFIIGVWVGSKIGPKEQENATFETAAINVTQSSQPTNETVTLPPPPPANATAEQPVDFKDNASTQAFVPPPQPVYQENKTEAKITEKKSVVKPKETEVKETTKPKETTSKTKEVAQLSNQIKKGTFGLQVGAFSQKESAEKLRALAEKKGYPVTVKAVASEGKTLYKVYVGRYSNREEAEKAVSKVASDLGVSKPFVVELK